MADYAMPFALVAATLLLGAWREYRSDNPRDAKLLAGFGLGSTLAGAVTWLV